MPVGQPYDYLASVLSFGERSTISAGLSRYLAAPGGTVLASDLAVVAPRAGTLKNLRWSAAASTLTAAGHKLTLYVNGAATSLTATWNGTAVSGSGTPALVPVAAGDAVSVRIQLAAGGGTITRPRVSLELELPSAIPWLANGADMVYIGGGNVGIGTGSPGEALTVDGVIQTTVGFRFPDGSFQDTAHVMKPLPQPPPVVPPGSVIAYAGPSAPSGWLLCDGSLVDRATYSDLFDAIGTAHGGGDGTTTFALPDYRGMFLRGVTGATWHDPDAESRRAPAGGGNAGNAVGSRQDDQLVSHVHALGLGTGDSFSMVPLGGPNTSRLASFVADGFNHPGKHSTHPSGGNENRPKNAYVHFLIKI